LKGDQTGAPTCEQSKLPIYSRHLDKRLERGGRSTLSLLKTRAEYRSRTIWWSSVSVTPTICKPLKASSPARCGYWLPPPQGGKLVGLTDT